MKRNAFELHAYFASLTNNELCAETIAEMEDSRDMSIRQICLLSELIKRLKNEKETLT